MAKIVDVLPEVTGEEMLYLQNIIQSMDDEKARSFATVYRSRRKDPQMVLILALLGFVGFSGIHRFVINQIGMGILYFFTAGLCLIGTIIDLVNYQKLAFEFNRTAADEAAAMVR
jgi:TM2 domain-containing membrane protein YozV